MFSATEAPKEGKQQTLSAPLDDDFIMNDEPLESNEQNFGPMYMVKMLLSGEYTYITYMIMSTTSFIFWLSPNFHKLRSFFGSKSRQENYQH